MAEKGFILSAEEELQLREPIDEYIGKIPKKVEGDVYISKEIRILKEDLIRAVEKEEYEKAADIRDKIKHLQKCNE